jgi:hypothetical protein
MVRCGWRSEWTTAGRSDYLFSKFFEEFPGPPQIQAVLLHLSNGQRDANLDRPTRCRHIQKRGSAPPNSRPVFLQVELHPSVVKFDMPTGSGINSVPDTADHVVSIRGHSPRSSRASTTRRGLRLPAHSFGSLSRATAAPAAIVRSPLGR